MGKAMNAGTAARTGVVAAALAERGFTSGDGVLAGFTRTYGGPAELSLSHPLDGRFAVATGGLSLKRYPSCGVTQAPIEAALRLAVPGRPVDDIEDVFCLVDPFIRRLLITYPPRNGNEARFNLEHCVAVALIDGEVGMAQFADERVDDPVVRALATRVRIGHRAVGVGSPDMRWPCEVRVTGRDGATVSAVVDEPAGRSFGELLPESELDAKFTDCARWAGLTEPEVAELMANLNGLAVLPTLESLTNGLRRRLPRVDTVV
jgi:2-methylcitrate dehydratase PrpD